VVVLRNGHEYEGTVRLAGGFVHIMHGRRRVREDGGLAYHHADDRSWPCAAIREIRWFASGPVTE
jgi:hypothetical protein